MAKIETPAAARTPPIPKDRGKYGSIVLLGQNLSQKCEKRKGIIDVFIYLLQTNQVMPKIHLAEWGYMFIQHISISMY